MKNKSVWFFIFIIVVGGGYYYSLRAEQKSHAPTRHTVVYRRPELPGASTKTEPPAATAVEEKKAPATLPSAASATEATSTATPTAIEMAPADIAMDVPIDHALEAMVQADPSPPPTAALEEKTVAAPPALIAASAALVRQVPEFLRSTHSKLFAYLSKQKKSIKVDVFWEREGRGTTTFLRTLLGDCQSRKMRKKPKVILTKENIAPSEKDFSLSFDGEAYDGLVLLNDDFQTTKKIIFQRNRSPVTVIPAGLMLLGGVLKNSEDAAWSVPIEKDDFEDVSSNVSLTFIKDDNDSPEDLEKFEKVLTVLKRGCFGHGD